LVFKIGVLPRRGFGKMPNPAAKMAALPEEKGQRTKDQREILPRLRSSKPLETRARVESSVVGSGTAAMSGTAARKYV